MAQLIDIIRVVVGTEYLTATVQIAEDAPLMTSEDLEGTTRVYNLLPTIIDHACMGDAGSTFKDCMGDTELAHLLEHVTVELLARTNLVDNIVAGRTWRELAYDRTYSIRLDCVDDVLVAGALSSAVWIMDWAFSGGEGSVPDVDATVQGLVGLIQSLSDPDAAQLIGQGDYQDDYDDASMDSLDAYEQAIDEPYDGQYYDDQPFDDWQGEELDRGPRMSRKII
ncbi:MAG: hypothetical protein J6S63_04060 [Atopobiaceae bacterium]|nr:hypothetical protein [Atopobiaceae bacterium]